MDFRDMNNVVRVGGKDEGDEMGMDMDVTVQPGVGWMELNDFLRERGVGGWLPVDPAPGAKVGGMVSFVSLSAFFFIVGGVGEGISNGFELRETER